MKLPDGGRARRRSAVEITTVVIETAGQMQAVQRWVLAEVIGVAGFGPKAEHSSHLL